jgi:hypothetical protein
MDRLPKIEDYVSKGLGSGYREALDRLDKLIDGFQSPYLMELLASVDWLLREREGQASDEDLSAAIAAWPGGREAGRRKTRLFKQDAISLAHERLMREASVMYVSE